MELLDDQIKMVKKTEIKYSGTISDMDLRNAILDEGLTEVDTILSYIQIIPETLHLNTCTGKVKVCPHPIFQLGS